MTWHGCEVHGSEGWKVGAPRVGQQQHVEGSGHRPVVRPIVVAHRGGGGGMWQGAVQVAHDGAGDEESSSMGHIIHVMPM